MSECGGVSDGQWIVMVAFSSSAGSLALGSSVEVVVEVVEGVLCLRLSLLNLPSLLSLVNLASPLSLVETNLVSPLSLVETHLAVES